MPVLFPNRRDFDHAPTSGEAFKLFNERIRTLIQDRKTGLKTLQIDWKDRNQAAVWANLLVQKLNAEMRKRALDKAEVSIAFLEKELNSTTEVVTRDAISRLIEIEIKRRMLANVTREFAFRVVDKAVAPDDGDVIKPRKVLLVALGMLSGIAIGIFVVLLWGGVKPETDSL